MNLIHSLLLKMRHILITGKVPFSFHVIKKYFLYRLQGGLNGSYEFAQAHLHWGSTDDVGSEHTINGKHYPMEMHLVFWNKQFPNLVSAVESRKRDALGII